jgi:hypothetical protein
MKKIERMCKSFTIKLLFLELTVPTRKGVVERMTLWMRIHASAMAGLAGEERRRHARK